MVKMSRSGKEQDVGGAERDVFTVSGNVHADTFRHLSQTSVETFGMKK